jgi:hypothetical protein
MSDTKDHLVTMMMGMFEHGATFLGFIITLSLIKMPWLAAAALFGLHGLGGGMPR